MISGDDALAAVLAAVPPPEPERLPLSAAVQRFVLRDVHAALSLPGFDNAAMDGWALHAADCGQTGVPLRITGEQPAGRSRRLAVHPGEAVRIFTGAPIPSGTAAVVMQEDAVRSGEFVTVRDAAREGDFIRRAGSDVCAGQLLAGRGQVLTPQRIGVLAAQGLASIECGRQPQAAIVCTGEELITPGEPLPHDGCLYNSNGPMLAALLASSRTASVTAVDTARDELALLTATLRRHLEDNDVLIVAGGVSVGDHDLVKPALQALGITPEFRRVSIRPGKPFLFCTHGRKLIFGLPGNPVSAWVTAVLFVLPALRRMAGALHAAPVFTGAVTLTPLHNGGDRTHFMRGCFDPEQGTFTPVGVQESHAVAGLAGANALAKLEPGARLHTGSAVQVLRLD